MAKEKYLCSHLYKHVQIHLLSSRKDFFSWMCLWHVEIPEGQGSNPRHAVACTTAAEATPDPYPTAPQGNFLQGRF